MALYVSCQLICVEGYMKRCTHESRFRLSLRNQQQHTPKSLAAADQAILSAGRLAYL